MKSKQYKAKSASPKLKGNTNRKTRSNAVKSSVKRIDGKENGWSKKYSSKGGRKNKLSNKMKMAIKKYFKRRREVLCRTMKEGFYEYKYAESKVFCNTCNLMTLTIVILCSIFVYMEKSLLYSLPLVSVLAIFIKCAKGNRYGDNSESDLILYKKILLLNLFLVLIALVEFKEDLWFVNFFAILIFVVPLIVSRYIEN